MTSGEYLKQLEKYLRKLPQSDYEDAMEYFTEYFADAGPENEQAVIKELGTPKQAAAELMRNLLDKKVDEREAMEKEAGSLGFLRRILLYYRNGRFHAGNQYSVRGVRRILCKMDGTAVRVVYT